MEVTKDLISLILVPNEISLSFQMVESLVRAAVAWAILLTAALTKLQIKKKKENLNK